MQTTKLAKNSVYNNFTVLDVLPIDAWKSVGIWLRHNKTGLQVFHMLNDDEENLFGFAFPTLPSDSTGAAHILEHSVLCGSENFPLKDPFLQLSNQSVKTFLNAMTFPDKTLYPASSISRQDYFNLMAVYGDAVFRPLLDEKVFLQEGHRLEADENGEISIQGVVYNEMKGNFSSFDSVLADLSSSTVLPDSPYGFNAGGDPTEIPNLTYEQFKAFHRKNYHPQQCRLFLYGNIPTETQLDFLEEKFLSDSRFFLESLDESILKVGCGIPYPPPVTYSEPRYIEMPAPKQGGSSSEDGSGGVPDSGGAGAAGGVPACASGAAAGGVPDSGAAAAAGAGHDSSVVLTWLIGDSSDPLEYMESVFLAEILLGHDASPLSRALVESGLGEDLAPVIGVESEMRYLYFSAGLRGMKRSDALKLEHLVLKVLSNLAENGISHSDIDTAVMSVEFADREIRRSHGPYSLVLMRRSLRGWLYGRHPAAALFNREAFAKIKERLTREGPSYLSSIITDRFLKNSCRVLLTVYPDDSFEKNMNEKTARLIETHSAALSKNFTREHFLKCLKEQHEQLERWQHTPDSPELKSLIPHLKPSDLSKEIDTIVTVQKYIHDVPVFVHNEAVNGIVYVEAGFPADVLDPADYKYLPFFTVLMTNCGFGGRDWAEAAAYTASVTGGFGASLFTSSPTLSMLEKYGAAGLSGSRRYAKMYEADPCGGRSWIFFRVKMLEEMAEEGINLLFSCIQTADLSDRKRIEDLAAEFSNDLSSSVIPSGNEYAASRAACVLSRSKAVDEIWNGLTQVENARLLKAAGADKTAAVMNRIKDTIVSSGLVLNITAGNEGLKKAENALEKLLSSYKAPSAPFPAEDAHFTAQIVNTPSLPVRHSDKNHIDECYHTNTQVGFAACSFSASPFGTAESVYESVAAHWLSNTVLWEKIRTSGGAYGAFAFADSIENIFNMATYRDPRPEQSVHVFIQSLHDAVQASFDDATVERLITGCYSKEVQPKSPSSRGFTGFVRSLYGITDEQRTEKLSFLLSLDEEKIKKAVERLFERSAVRRTAVLAGKRIQKAGKNFDLVL